MKFGQKLKQLRQAQGMTQPQLAEKIGIEQSYLSKLENDKSLPSAEMFQAICSALEVSPQTMLDGLSASVINELSAIPGVNEWQANQQKRQYRRSKWLLTGAAICSVAGASLYVGGATELVFSSERFQYLSKGIVLEGESREIFDIWRAQLSRQRSTAPDDEQWNKLNAQLFEQEKIMADRLNEDYLVTAAYQGEMFNVPVKGGSRTYELTQTRRVNQSANDLMQLFGVVFFLTGLFAYLTGWLLNRRR
jgi:transcriptional regulator with XRE-family HTH domain